MSSLAAARLRLMGGMPRNRWIEHIEPTGRQASFLSYTGRDALFGGAGGGGKSFAALLAAAQYACVPGYSALVLRRTWPELKIEGGIIDLASSWWSGSGARWNGSENRWQFPGGGSITFGYLKAWDDRLRYAGPPFQHASWEELTQWPTDKAFRWLFSRIRRPSLTADLPRCSCHGLSLADVPLRVRATANPGGPGHAWVRARYITGELPPGRRFYSAKMTDNPHLDIASYRESLAELPPIERARIEHGDWSVRDEGQMFRSHWFTSPMESWPVDDVPVLAQ